MKKLIFTAVIIILALSAKAQQVSYKVTSDDPELRKNFAIYVEPVYFDLYGTDFTLGWCLRADALLFKRLQLNFDFRRSYLDMVQMEHEKSTAALAKNGIKNHMWIEAGGSLFFTNKVKKRNLKVVLSSHRSGDYQYTKYIMVPGSKRKMWGVKASAYNMTTPIEITDEMAHTIKAEAKSGNGDTTSTSGTATMFNTTTIGAGLHWKSITDLWISSDYGNRGHTGVNDFYAEVLFAPLMIFTDLRGSDGNLYDIKPDKNNMKNIGWRVGMAYKRPNKWGMSYKMEFGSRPGYQQSTELIKNQKAFLLMTIGFDIPFRIGKYDKEKS